MSFQPLPVPYVGAPPKQQAQYRAALKKRLATTVVAPTTIPVASLPPPPPPEPTPIKREGDKKRPPTIAEIVAACASSYGVSRMDIISKRRALSVSRPRQVAMYLAKIMTVRSLPEIGFYLGGRDHTTIIHGVRNIAGLIEVDVDFRARVASIRVGLELSDEKKAEGGA